MDYSPPPLFKQGASANAKLFLFVVLSVCLIAIDSRVRMLEPVRTVIGTALYPFQRALLVPGDVLAGTLEYFSAQSHLLQTRQSLEKKATDLAHRAVIVDQVMAENAQLRQLLALRDANKHTWLAAEILYEVRETTNHRIVIDKGSLQGLSNGMPVMDNIGVIGQVVRTFPLSAEVNLITDRNQAIPVQVARNKLRAVAYGGIEGDLLEIRFMASNADIQVGDDLYTSGVDGVYPAGLPVAKVLRVDKDNHFGFAKIICQPIAGVSSHRHVVVMTSKIELPAPPPPPVETAKPKRRG